MSIAKPQIKNGLQEKFKVSLDELKSMISEKRIRSDELKQSLEELMDLKLEFNVLDNEKWKSWHKMVLVSEISIDDKDVTFSFPPTIRENIINPEVYGIIDMKINKALEHKHSIPIYEFCKDYLDVNIPKLELEVFKKLLGIEGKYSKPAHLKRDVLDKAINEINDKSDIKIRFDFVRTGNSVTHIQFFSENRKKSNEIVKTLENTEFVSSIEMIKNIFPQGLQNKDLAIALEKSKKFTQSNGVDYVKYAILYTLDRYDENIGFLGYFVKVLNNNWHEKFMESELKSKEKARPKKAIVTQISFDDLEVPNLENMTESEKKFYLKSQEIAKKGVASKFRAF